MFIKNLYSNFEYATSYIENIIFITKPKRENITFAFATQFL